MRQALVSEIYVAQVDLLLEVLPIVARHSEFGVKGGTALNLFYLDMPRLSVDIDLCYMPIRDRKDSFQDIHRILGEMKSEIEGKLGFAVHPTKPLSDEREARLNVSRDKIVIKIEPNYVLRGCLFEPEEKEVTDSVQTKFKKTATALVLNKNDLYGGKFCAALDRQHPRDLFDVYNYFNDGQITTEVKDSFLFYLLSHNRPMQELLDPRDLDIKSTYETEFRGMNTQEVTFEKLLLARKMLQTKLLASFDDQDRNLLLSFADNAPDWSLYRYPKIKDYPSIRWKLFNLGKADKFKRDSQLSLLESILSG